MHTLQKQLTFLLKGLLRLLSFCKHCCIIRSSKHMTNIQSVYIRIGEVYSPYALGLVKYAVIYY